MNILLELNSLIKFLKYSNHFKYFKNLTKLGWLAQVGTTLPLVA